MQGSGSNLGSKSDSSSENLTLGQSGARIFLAGPEALVVLPSPCPAPHTVPHLGVVGAGSSLQGPSWALLVWTADFSFLLMSGAKAPTPKL